jgi:hypothetical protein
VPSRGSERIVLVPDYSHQLAVIKKDRRLAPFSLEAVERDCGGLLGQLSSIANEVVERRQMQLQTLAKHLGADPSRRGGWSQAF